MTNKPEQKTPTLRQPRSKKRRIQKKYKKKLVDLLADRLRAKL